MEADWERGEEVIAKDRKEYMNRHQSIATRRQTVFNYLDEPAAQRLELKKFLKTHRIQKRTFYILEGEYRAMGKLDKQEHKEELKATVLDAWDRIEGREPPKRTSKGAIIKDISEEEKLALARKVYDDAMKQGASASEKDVAVKMLGLMIDQRGVRRSGLTADEIARRNIEAERELNRWRSARGMAGQGVEEVPG